jgi:hypothetical protein
VRGLDRAFARPDVGFLLPSSAARQDGVPVALGGPKRTRFVVNVSGVGYRLLE